MDTGTILAGLVVSTVGFSVFLYGKKQQRVPQLVVGVLMMAMPFAVTDPLWMSVTGAALLIALRLALARGDW